MPLSSHCSESVRLITTMASLSPETWAVAEAVTAVPPLHALTLEGAWMARACASRETVLGHAPVPGEAGHHAVVGLGQVDAVPRERLTVVRIAVSGQAELVAVVDHRQPGWV